MIPNPFTAAIGALRVWLTPLFANILQLVGTLNGLVGSNAWAPITLKTAAALPANTYSGTAKTLTGNATGILTVDGVQVKQGMRIWVGNEVTGLRDGIYVVTNPGWDGSNGKPAAAYVLTRADDANASGDFVQNKVFSILLGDTNANTLWKLTNATFTLGTDTPTISDITGAAVSVGSGDMVLADAQTVTGAKTFDAATLKQNNGAGTFATTFASAATAARTATFPDASGTVLQDAGAQTITGAKTFATATLILRNAADTFSTTFTTLATAARAVVFPDGAGNVLLDALAQTISAAKTFANNTFLLRNGADSFSTTVTAPNATADRTLTLPDSSGTAAHNANIKSIVCQGLNGAGACTAPGLVVGDKVALIWEISGVGPAANGIGDFESVITVNDQIQQTSVSDLSAVQILGFVIRP